MRSRVLHGAASAYYNMGVPGWCMQHSSVVMTSMWLATYFLRNQWKVAIWPTSSNFVLLETALLAQSYLMLTSHCVNQSILDSLLPHVIRRTAEINEGTVSECPMFENFLVSEDIHENIQHRRLQLLFSWKILGVSAFTAGPFRKIYRTPDFSFRPGENSGQHSFLWTWNISLLPIVDWINAQKVVAGYSVTISVGRLEIRAWGCCSLKNCLYNLFKWGAGLIYVYARDGRKLVL